MRNRKANRIAADQIGKVAADGVARALETRRAGTELSAGQIAEVSGGIGLTGVPGNHPLLQKFRHRDWWINGKPDPEFLVPTRLGENIINESVLPGLDMIRPGSH